MRQYFSCILFCGFLFHVPSSVLSADCNDLKDGCKRCKGDAYEGCRFGTLQPLYQCGTGMTCIRGSDGCSVQCMHGSSASAPASAPSAKSAASNPAGPPKSSVVAPSSSQAATEGCSTGNKGEVVPNGCGYCMGKSLLMTCTGNHWQSPKSCSGGEVCKGGLSHNNKVDCDGKCARE